jgi:teichuronic acid biosynthesis glycosyltransferase TuaG
MALKNPRVSIIVPVYHSEEYITQCVESILGQTFTDFEVFFIIDDFINSRDFEILTEYATRDSRIHIDIRSLKTTCANARNAGIKSARGEYIAFCDADDWWEPRKLEMQVAYMDAHHGVSWCWGYALHHDGNRTHAEASSWEDPSPVNMIPFQTIFMRKTLVDEMINKNGDLFNSNLKQIDDYDLYIRLKKYPNYHTTEILSHYRVHDKGITSSSSKYVVWLEQTKILFAREHYWDLPYMAVALGAMVWIDSKILFEKCWRYVLRRPKTEYVQGN